MKFLIFSLLILAGCAFPMLGDRKADRGIFYEDVKPKKERKSEEEKKKKEFVFPVRPDAPEPVKQFLVNPNEETAKEFLRWQYRYFKHLEKVGFVLRDTALKYAPEVYPIMGYPESVLIATNYPGLRQELFKKAVARVRDKFGLIYFFSSQCRFCRLQSPLIEKLHRDFGISVRGVSVDGGLIPEDIPQVANPGLARRFGITSVPAVVAVIDREGEPEIYFLAVGFTPLDQLQAQIIRLLKLKGLINEFELNVNFHGGDEK